MAVLEAQALERVPSLVPVRHGRMLASPFGFFRGAAAVMAADLAAQPSPGIRAQLCGDAHLSNFGLFAALDRHTLFDINDFDETLLGPFEWDVKRLVASVAVAAATLGFDASSGRAAAAGAAHAYRTFVSELAEADTLDVWYSRVEFDSVIESLKKKGSAACAAAEHAERAALKRTSLQAFEKLTAIIDGQRRIVADPPLVVPVEGEHGRLSEAMFELFEGYLGSLPAAARKLASRYRVVDVAVKVCGVGSVGLRALILLLESGDGEPFFLQFKEARPSVLEDYLEPSEFSNAGQRVVEGQRLIQGSSDSFLGWSRGVVEDRSHDFYFRQLRDHKGAVDPHSLHAAGLVDYARLCGRVLARAHARSGDAATVAGYLGKHDAFERAMGDFAMAYVAQNALDHRALIDAVDSGRLEARTGL